MRLKFLPLTVKLHEGGASVGPTRPDSAAPASSRRLIRRINEPLQRRRRQHFPGHSTVRISDAAGELTGERDANEATTPTSLVSVAFRFVHIDVAQDNAATHSFIRRHITFPYAICHVHRILVLPVFYYYF